MATHSSILAWSIHVHRSLVGYSPGGLKGSDTTERLSTHADCEANCIGENWVRRKEKQSPRCQSCHYRGTSRNFKSYMVTSGITHYNFFFLKRGEGNYIQKFLLFEGKDMNILQQSFMFFCFFFFSFMFFELHFILCQAVYYEGFKS